MALVSIGWALLTIDGQKKENEWKIVGYYLNKEEYVSKYLVMKLQPIHYHEHESKLHYWSQQCLKNCET